MTDAMPTPTPPTMRHRIRSHMPVTRPEPIALAASSRAATCMVRTRPRRSASVPAYQAPAAEPSRAQDTARPILAASSSKPPRMASTAPLITAVSNPNRKPPSAAAAAINTMRAVARCSSARSTGVSRVLMRSSPEGPKDDSGASLAVAAFGVRLNTYAWRAGTPRRPMVMLRAPAVPEVFAAVSKAKATSIDIAHLAGVSQATVSRALRGSPLVSEETRERIRAAAEQLNYKVDKNASNLRLQHSGALALLLFEDPTTDGSNINPRS